MGAAPGDEEERCVSGLHSGRPILGEEISSIVIVVDAISASGLSICEVSFPNRGRGADVSHFELFTTTHSLNLHAVLLNSLRRLINIRKFSSTLLAAWGE